MNDIAGIDEAGRGPTIGPMVIAGVSIDKKNESKLKALGLKDSKLLTPKKREELAKEIEKIAKDIIIIKLSPCRIDNMRNQGINLNKIESMKFTDILVMLNSDTVYIDSPDVKPDRLKEELQKEVNSKLIVEHKADYKYPIVSAASIIAKVTRDDEISELHKKWGDFGPGYSSNDKTISWLKNWISNNKEWPDIVRKTWETAIRIKSEKSQKGLFGFLRKEKEGCNKTK